MKRGAAGFSLLEVILATMIFGVVITAAYALFASSRSLADRAAAEATLLQEARIVLGTLRRDLEGAYGTSSAYKTDLKGTSSGTAEEPRGELELLSANNSTLHGEEVQIDLTRITYSVLEEEEGAAQRGLVRTKEKVLTDTRKQRDEEEAREEIGPNVRFVRFRYFDGDAWQETWDSSLSGSLPKSIEVTVYIRTGEESTQSFTTKIYLPIAADAPRTQP